jgi:hypothetical protein
MDYLHMFFMRAERERNYKKKGYYLFNDRSE